VVLVTEWDVFNSLTPDVLTQMMRGRIVVD
jgi:hypothetical protein